MGIAWILAAGGGGSSGFSGGGGGGGGGFSGGGGGFSGGGGGFSGGGSSGGSMSFGGFMVVLVIAVLFFVVPGVLAARRRRRGRVARQQRSSETRRAAAEAAQDGAYFAADVVAAAALVLFKEVQRAWDARDRPALQRVAGPDLFKEWKLRLDDFDAKGWHNRVAVTHEPVIDYVGLDNREDDAEDRVVVSIECHLEDYVEAAGGRTVFKEGQKTKEVRLCEYWTLRWTGTAWQVDSIQSEDEGAGVLKAPLVATPWGDEGRLHDAAVIEGAVAEAAPAGSPSAGELVDLDYAHDARAAALDLSLVDGRFAPAVLEAAVRRAVPAWVAAVDGGDEELLRVATPEAVHALLYPRGGDDVRLVIRGGTVEVLRIVALDTAAEPAEMTVAVTLRGRRYLEDRATAAVVEGSRERETTTVEQLVLRLDDADPAVPWRVVGRASSDAPAGGR